MERTLLHRQEEQWLNQPSDRAQLATVKPGQWAGREADSKRLLITWEQDPRLGGGGGGE